MHQEVQEWQRVSPRYVWVEFVSTLVGAAAASVAFIVPLALGWWLAVVPLAAVAAWTIVFLALTPRRVRAIGYILRDDDLLFRRGVLVQRMVAVPYGRMQLVDITRGPVSRALGLAELKFVTAAAATGVSIPGLPVETAESLRESLVGLAETRRAGL